MAPMLDGRAAHLNRFFRHKNRSTNYVCLCNVCLSVYLDKQTYRHDLAVNSNSKCEIRENY